MNLQRNERLKGPSHLSGKALFLIQYPSLSPISMEDMTHIQAFLKKFPMNYELKWDMISTETPISKFICTIRI